LNPLTDPMLTFEVAEPPAGIDNEFGLESIVKSGVTVMVNVRVWLWLRLPLVP